MNTLVREENYQQKPLSDNYIICLIILCQPPIVGKEFLGVKYQLYNLVKPKYPFLHFYVQNLCEIKFSNTHKLHLLHIETNSITSF